MLEIEDMRKYKAIAISIMAAMLVPFIQSCLDEADDDFSNIQSAIPFNAALATVVIPNKMPGEAVIESDNEGKAYVVNPDKLTLFEANNAGQRIFYTYINATNPSGNTDKEGPFIAIDYLQKILTKPMDTLKEGEEDLYGHDGINLITPIMGKTHLTLMFQIATSNSNIKHRISLVAMEGAVPDENGYLAVELRHNAEGDRQEYTSHGYVSFPLSGIPGYEEGKLKGFNIKTNTMNHGEETVTISYNKSKSTGLTSMQNEMSNTKIK